MKIYYEINDENALDDITHYFKETKKYRPNWWNNLSSFWWGEKSLKSFFEKYGLFGKFSDVPETAKMCPAFHGLFSNSIALKSPAEIFIQTEGDNLSWKSSNKSISIAIHNKEQAPEYLGEKYHFVKFQFPILYAVDKPCTLVIQNSTLYNSNDYEVCPGMVNLSSKTPMVINIICLFEKNKNKQTYLISPDQVLGLYTFSEPISCLEQRDLYSSFGDPISQRKYFINWHKKI
jgi:hypothetical protein